MNNIYTQTQKRKTAERAKQMKTDVSNKIMELIRKTFTNTPRKQQSQQSILEHKHFLKSRNPKEKHIRVQLENNGASKQMETQTHPKKLGINLKNLQGQYKPGK